MTVASTGIAHAQVPEACTPGVNCAPYSCDPGEACLFYNSIENGLNGIFKQDYAIFDYAPFGFQLSTYGNGVDGRGKTVKNNAAAAWNRTNQRFGIYYNSNLSCAVACQLVPSLARVNLNSSLKNNNASGDLF